MGQVWPAAGDAARLWRIRSGVYAGRMPQCESGTLNTLCLRSRAAQPFQLCAQAGIFNFQSLGAGVLSFGTNPFSFGTGLLCFCTGVCGLCGLFRRWHNPPSGGKKA
jgi:hypothetical protein